MILKPASILRLLCLLIIAQLILLFSACDREHTYEQPEFCSSNWTPNISLAELQLIYEGETLHIQEDWVMEAYVISSDQEGNFFGSIHIQDLPENPTAACELLIDLPDTYLFYPPGHRIVLRLKGLYFGKDGEHFQLGGVSSFFENQKVGRLPANLVEEHLQLSCDKPAAVVPKPIFLEGLEFAKPGTYIEIDSVQFAEEVVGLPFAEPEQETSRLLEDCYGNTIELLNSGYADFASSPLPGGGGKITGILSKDGDDYVIFLNQLADVRFNGERCPPGPEPISSDSLFISEIADPDNNSEARFVELFNAGEQELPLIGWTLERYTNDNLEAGSVTDLSELSIPGKGTLLIASNAVVFEGVYGFPPHLEGGRNSAADSNGDDNLLLKDPFGMVIDIFGRIGEDGSNTDHEFEDGKAVRKPGVTRANPTYDPAEWDLYNDTGLAGTFNQPQLAPDDYSPGIHNN